MAESARKHGPFDDRRGGERLEWSAFLAQFFPKRGRHDFAAPEAYEAYRDTLEQESPRERPATRTSVTGAGRRRPARVTASPAAVPSWESGGGASAERPAGCWGRDSASFAGSSAA